MSEIVDLQNKVYRLHTELSMVENKLKEALIAGCPIKVVTRMIERRNRLNELIDQESRAP